MKRAAIAVGTALVVGILVMPEAASAAEVCFRIGWWTICWPGCPAGGGPAAPAPLPPLAGTGVGVLLLAAAARWGCRRRRRRD